MQWLVCWEWGQPPPPDFIPKGNFWKGLPRKGGGKGKPTALRRQIISYEFKVTCGFAKVYEMPLCRVGGRGGAVC